MHFQGRGERQVAEDIVALLRAAGHQVSGHVLKVLYPPTPIHERPEHGVWLLVSRAEEVACCAPIVHVAVARADPAYSASVPFPVVSAALKDSLFEAVVCKRLHDEPLQNLKHASLLTPSQDDGQDAIIDMEGTRMSNDRDIHRELLDTAKALQLVLEDNSRRMKSKANSKGVDALRHVDSTLFKNILARLRGK